MTGPFTGIPSDSGYLASDLISVALRQIGVGAVGTTASSADVADGLFHLNAMLAGWQRKRWLVPAIVDISAISTGNLTMHVGPGQDVDCDLRPDKIEYAFARYLGNGAARSNTADFAPGDFTSDFAIGSGPSDGDGTATVPAIFSPTQFDATEFSTDETFVGVANNDTLAFDYPLYIIQSREDYSAIRLKNLRTWPQALYYSPEFPYGVMNVWPIPQAGLWEIHVGVKQTLQSGLTAASPINLPPEYWDAIMWILAARLAPSYGQEAGPTVTAFAKSALQTIRVANTQIPSLSLPADLFGTRRGYGFNIFSRY